MKALDWNRRDWIKGAAVAGGVTLANAKAAIAMENSIVAENAKPGTRDWLLRNPRVDPESKYRCPWLEGYCSHTSILAGETLSIHVSARPASIFKIEIFRMGYYGGDGGRLMKSITNLQGEPRADPPVGEKRLRDCEWPSSAEFAIPTDWPSGVYLGKLTAAESGIDSYVVFIIRDERPHDFLFQCSDFTWQAYNRWPNRFALYDDGKSEWFWGGGVQVGFNRPYGKYCQIFDQPLSTGSGEFLLWEFPLVYWLEREGYDVGYLSNLDLHLRPDSLKRARGFLSVGHDEYWSIEMFRHLQQGIADGLSVGFLSGNAVCGRVEVDLGKRAFERIGVFGPPGGTQEFVAMKDLSHERPYANTLIGAHSTGPVTGGADWVCRKAEHWIFEGTEMKNGDAIRGLVGWEWHGDPAPIPGLEIVASGPTQSAPGVPNGGEFTATVYPGPKGNFVFNAATIWWADGLSEPPGYLRPSVYTTPQGPDSRVARITANVLARMRANRLD
jgi:hypothetical protein